MKLKSLDTLEVLNSQELNFIVGGSLTRNGTVCWEDSTSKDSKKHDTGGYSKKQDEPAFILAY